MVCLLILSDCCCVAAAEDPAAVAPIKLEQIISREDPKFNCTRASLTIGRDGRDKLGGASVPAIHNATADLSGLIASSNGHFSHQVAIYDKEFRKINAVTAVACPFRNVESYPPITLSNVDEIALQAQWEQIGLPYHAPFSVDFYKRPGKKAWGHPEVWNDAGTGDQILTTLWQMIMRGINGVLNQYGPWFASMQNHDRVAIVASGRMYKIDDWVGATGSHFARVMEAYVACLHAHRPASIVFAEDIKPDKLGGDSTTVVHVDRNLPSQRACRASLSITKSPRRMAPGTRGGQSSGIPFHVDGPSFSTANHFDAPRPP